MDAHRQALQSTKEARRANAIEEAKRFGIDLSQRRGVTRSSAERWQAQKREKGVTVFCGSVDNEEEAVVALWKFVNES